MEIDVNNKIFTVSLSDKELDIVKTQTCKHLGYKKTDKSVKIKFAIFDARGKMHTTVDRYDAIYEVKSVSSIVDFGLIQFMKFGFIIKDLPAVVQIHLFQDNKDKGQVWLMIDPYGLLKIMTTDHETIWKRKKNAKKF